MYAPIVIALPPGDYGPLTIRYEGVVRIVAQTPAGR